MSQFVLFAVFPYVAVVLAVVVGIHRYRTDRFSYTTHSSELLEKRALFWGSVPWHYAIIAILLAHVLALLAPGPWGNLISDAGRLWALEVTGLALALVTVVSLALLTARRLAVSRARSVTSAADALLLVVLLAQVSLGFWVALFYRWGSDWYLHTAVPWIVSLAALSPKVEYVTALPWPVQAHMVGGFLVIAIFPFTRLVHVVTVPFEYLWRPHQVVIWNRRPFQR